MLEWYEMQALLLIFTRITAFTSVAPFFAFRSVPVYSKVGLGFVLTVLLFPVIDLAAMPEAVSMLEFIVMLLQELLLGLVLGFITTLIFAAVRVAGELVDLHIGFAMATVLDPQTGMRSTLVGQFLYILAILVFLALDGHHSLIMALGQSFDLVPLGEVVFERQLGHQVLLLFTKMFAMGLKIAAPIIAVVLISDISLSLISRTVPQLNVFIMGFPLKAGLGMLSLIIIMPLFAVVISSLLSQLEKDLMEVIRSFP